MRKTIVLIFIMLFTTSLSCDEPFIKMFELVEDIVNDPDNLEQSILDYGYISDDFWEVGYGSLLAKKEKLKDILKSFNSCYYLRDFYCFSYPGRDIKDEKVYCSICFTNYDSTYYISILFYKKKQIPYWIIYGFGLSGEHAFPVYKY
jgi:hypothetical protein